MFTKQQAHQTGKPQPKPHESVNSNIDPIHAPLQLKSIIQNIRSNSQPLSTRDISILQRTIGNQRISQLVSKKFQSPITIESPNIQRFRVTDVRNVPSLVVKDWRIHRLPGNWNTLESRLRQRDRRVAERLSLIKVNSDDHTVLLRLQNRWRWFRSHLAQDNPDTIQLPQDTHIANALHDERGDRDALQGSTNRVIRSVINEFIEALENYLSARSRLDAERTSYHRFDPLFVGQDVQKLLAAISGAAFTTADLKALTGQETADFTNINVHGIRTDKPGITTSRPNRHGFIGLGQHSTISMSEAIQWAKSHGVTIQDRPDPRQAPATSILLTAAYLGRVVDILHNGLPAPIPNGDEFKKLVFASYNGGPQKIIRAVMAYLAGRSAVYTWDNIKNNRNITGQMRNYVTEIVERLN